MINIVGNIQCLRQKNAILIGPVIFICVMAVISRNKTSQISRIKSAFWKYNYKHGLCYGYYISYANVVS